MSTQTFIHRVEPINGRKEIGKLLVSTGVTSVDLTHGMGTVTGVQLTLVSTAVVTSLPAVNETLPLGGSTSVTIGCTSGMTILYEITGY
jgi:hypothetical protein